jgi:toxin ParE1/3/4
MRLTYLSLAVLDLAEIRSYLSGQDPSAAQRVGSKLRDILNRLERFANLGKPGRVFGTRELITPKIGKTAYIVVYCVKQDEIQILRILPGMRDIDALLEEGFPNEEN